MAWRRVLPCALLLAGCHFETRQPQGSAGDEAAVTQATTGFYRAMARRDSVALQQMTFGAATVLLTAGHSAPSLIAGRALRDLPERRSGGGEVRVVRTEVRLDGDLASVRATIATRDRGDAGEFEASDQLTLARRDGGWRVAHALLGSWHPRTAP